MKFHIINNKYNNNSKMKNKFYMILYEITAGRVEAAFGGDFNGNEREIRG